MFTGSSEILLSLGKTEHLTRRVMQNLELFGAKSFVYKEDNIKCIEVKGPWRDITLIIYSGKGAEVRDRMFWLIIPGIGWKNTFQGNFNR
jgi:hypothetical protein